MKTLLTDSLMRLTQLLHMIGGKDQYTAYCQFLHILVHGHGNSGVGGTRFIGFKNLSNLSMIIHVSVHADQGPYTKE